MKYFWAPAEYVISAYVIFVTFKFEQKWLHLKEVINLKHAFGQSFLGFFIRIVVASMKYKKIFFYTTVKSGEQAFH